jgi:hypothetical protein
MLIVEGRSPPAEARHQQRRRKAPGSEARGVQHPMHSSRLQRRTPCTHRDSSVAPRTHREAPSAEDGGAQHPTHSSQLQIELLQSLCGRGKEYIVCERTEWLYRRGEMGENILGEKRLDILGENGWTRESSAHVLTYSKISEPTRTTQHRVFFVLTVLSDRY